MDEEDFESIDFEEEDEVFLDREYFGSQCPDCFRVFSSDDEFLSHICRERIYD